MEEKVLRAPVRPSSTNYSNYSKEYSPHTTREFCCESPARFYITFCSDYAVGITCVGWHVTYAEELL